MLRKAGFRTARNKCAVYAIVEDITVEILPMVGVMLRIDSRSPFSNDRRRGIPATDHGILCAINAMLED